MRKAKLYILNSLAVSGAGLILRFAGMAYTVYISGRLGSEKVGLLTLILSVYGLASTFSVSGVGLTLTRLTADALALKNPREARRSLFACTLYSLFFGCLSALLLWLFAPLLGRSVIADPSAPLCLRALCPALIVSSLTACFSGYFTAARRVSKTAVSSLSGQGVKMLLTAVFFALLLPRGMGVEAVVFASCLSEICAFLLLLFILVFDLKKNLPRAGTPRPRLPSRLLRISLPLAFAAWVRSALVTVEHILIPRGLARSGSANALADYGVMHGMALPVVFFPYAVLTPFTALLMPEISRFKAERKERDIAFVSSLTIRLTLLFASGCAGFLFFFGREFGAVLYRGAPDAGKMIALFALLIPVMYADTAADSILKGLGEQVYCMKINIADAALSLVLVFFIVPRAGAWGYLFTVFFSECFNTLFSVRKLKKKTTLSVPLFFSVLLPVLSSALAAFAARAALSRIPLPPAPRIAVGAALFFLLYLPLLRFSGALLRDDRRYLFRLFRKS